MISTTRHTPAAVQELLSSVAHGTATLDELRNLVAAQVVLDELVRSCLEQLRDGAGSAGSPVHSETPAADFGWAGDASAIQVARFWAAFGGLLAWDFVPTDFLHALYLDWRPSDPDGRGSVELTSAAFARRINVTATADGSWAYARMRGSRQTMGAFEPLLDRVEWEIPADGRARYGIRRVQA